LAEANKHPIGSIVISNHHFVLCSGRVPPPALFLSGWILAPSGNGSLRVDQLYQLPEALKPAAFAALSTNPKRLAEANMNPAGSMAILPSVGAGRHELQPDLEPG
jgi:hypothetical protein